MTSSWDSYYIVFLSAVLSLFIPVALALISFVFFPKYKGKKASTQVLSEKATNKTVVGQRINIRFFLSANAALVLITLVLALIPCATTIQNPSGQGGQEGLFKGLLAIITLASFAVLGLLYSIRKGDMGWLSALQETKERNQ